MDNIENTTNQIWHLIKKIALLIIGIYIVFRYGPQIFAHLRPILITVLSAVILTYALLPSVDWLCKGQSLRLKPRTQRLLATSLVFVIFLSLLGLSISLMISPIGNEISQFTDKLKDNTAQIDTFFNRATKWYAEAVPQVIRDFATSLDYSKIGSWLSVSLKNAVMITSSSVGLMVEALLIPVLAFYFVLDHRVITREIYGLVPRRRRRDALVIGHRIGEIMHSYIFGQLILCVVAGILTGLFLTLMGMPYILVLALFAGITRAIPIIGPVVSGIPIVLVGLLYCNGHYAIPLWILAFIIIMHFWESKFLMPHLIGERLHLNPAVVIIVLLIGAEFMGLIGMFLAAPVTATIRELVRFYYISPRKMRLHHPKQLADETITSTIVSNTRS